jgi:hypothetical protein
MMELEIDSADPSDPSRPVTVTKRYGRMTILHHYESDGSLWGTSGRKILRRNPLGEWKKISRFPFAKPRDYFGFSRISTRAMRADKCNIYVNREGSILGIRAGQVFAIDNGNSPQKLFEIQGDAVLHGGICEDENGDIYFGEYFMNPDRNPVRIWRVSADLAHWEVAYTFSENTIRHVHGIYVDPFESETLWITTGDDEGECYLFKTQDRFKHVTRYGDGSQNYRAVRLFFTKDYITWATDSHVEQNYACRIARDSDILEIGQALDGSAWYGTMTRDGLYITCTTVEPGPAIQSNRSRILVSRDGFSWQEIHSFKKDFWRPMKVFKYGVISLPSGEMRSREVYISGEGLVGLDGKSMQLRINKALI